MKDDNAPITAYGIRPGSVVALVGGDSVPPRSPYTHAPAPAPTTTAHPPAPAPAPASNHSPVNSSMPPPPAPTQPITPSESPAPVNSQEAATITKFSQSGIHVVRSKLLPEVQSFLQVLAAPRQERPSPEELKQNHKKFVLNLAGPSTGAPARKVVNKKGGRWTDRVKAKNFQKRIEKRRGKAAEPQSQHATVPKAATSTSKVDKPAPKKPRNSTGETPAKSNPKPAAPSQAPRTQIISSLFSYNPKIEPAPQPIPGPSKPIGKPSNAPLTDSSTFEGLGLDPLITAHIQTKLGISKPTLVQRASLTALTHQSATTDRDAFIQSQTGSGKTLAFLLPIIQDLLPLSSLSYIDRSIGTLAIIIAPLANLLNRYRITGDAEADQDAGPRLTRWLVSGLLTGGATRAHEKARLRKGVPILVSTPGRLLDHLQNTESFNVSKCRWLVLDEADRLMELGFEETLTKMTEMAVKEGILGREVGGWDWERRRRTILCSATIREDVQKLAGMALQQPIVIKATSNDLTASTPATKEETAQRINSPLHHNCPRNMSWYL
ncbi:DEAD/DEAH box helicase [Rhizoctonia solani]|uniref:ATP-dependent RNA helicase n=1 Tax=Rhizoctonia solani TaxID=456999 RepID=A0A8H8SX21_9AGAM|nr:DEAD/DEAH box helicase [Rhizoctonia solani]QRW21641.1 DEAD/DEAH box helicase [Rhizoctonia solani]